MTAMIRRLGRRCVSVAFALALAPAFVLTACGSSNDGLTPSDAGIFTSPHAPDPIASPVVDGTFPIGEDGRVAVRCWGEGRPVVVLEAGTDSSGIAQFTTTIARPLAERTMTCTYDRLGTGTSDTAPHHRRTLDDLVAVLHSALRAASVPPPYLLVGSSGGGAIVVQYAGLFGDEVDGIVLLDVAAPEPDLAEEFPDEAGWDNVESVDWFAVEAHLAANVPSIPEIPVRIVTADSGDPDVRGQAFWLKLSPLATQGTLAGGHVLYRDNVEGVADEILSLLEAIGPTS